MAGTRKLEIRHFSHSEHALRFEYGSYSTYQCNGCRELGSGLRYHCRPCKFDMHESCARAPKSTSHFIHPQHLLVFKEKPASPRIVCDVCREKIEGFVYECRGCNIDLHPSCARLPHSLRHALHPHHTLELVPSHSTPYVCNVCGRGFTSPEMRYCYRCCEGSTPCHFILHISCAKLPVDPLEEMRMQSIAPLEVPCGHMFTGAPSGTAVAAQVISSSSTGTAAAAQVRSSSSTGTAAQVISSSSTGAASSSSTGAATHARSSLDVLKTGSAVLSFTSKVLDLVNSLSDDN